MLLLSADIFLGFYKFKCQTGWIQILNFAFDLKVDVGLITLFICKLFSFMDGGTNKLGNA